MCTRQKNLRKGLNTIHSDVCVTISSTSLSRYVHYVDDLDLFELGKNELFSKFKESKVLEENLPEKKIKILRRIIVKQCIKVQLQKLVSIQVHACIYIVENFNLIYKKLLVKL